MIIVIISKLKMEMEMSTTTDGTFAVPITKKARACIYCRQPQMNVARHQKSCSKSPANGVCSTCKSVVAIMQLQLHEVECNERKNARKANSIAAKKQRNAITNKKWHPITNPATNKKWHPITHPITNPVTNPRNNPRNNARRSSEERRAWEYSRV